MKHFGLLLSVMAGLLACVPLQAAKDVRAVSPNGKLLLERQGDGYVVRCGGRPAVILTQVGITTTSTGGELTFRRMYKCGRVKDERLKEVPPRPVA